MPPVERRRARPAHRRARRRAHPERRDDPDRHRRDPERDPGRAADHRDLGIHTELLSDGVDRPDRVGRGHRRAQALNRTKTVGTFALGTAASLRLPRTRTRRSSCWPCRYVNDPRVIASEHGFVSINATIEVDLLGQCASETIGGRYYSSSGGQADFARGAMYSEGGQGFVVLHSTADDGRASKIVPQLARRRRRDDAKNTVDKVVTEWGVAELRGRRSGSAPRRSSPSPTPTTARN